MKGMTRRETFRVGAGLAIRSTVLGASVGRARAEGVEEGERRRFLTAGENFTDVSRGDPVPHSLEGEALVKSRLTPETWRMEVAVEGKATVTKPLLQADGTAIDLQALRTLGETKGVMFLKAMQCNNIAQPLGQGLWEGVPLRDVLRLAGRMGQVRRVYYWGFHNDDPKQMFRSSLAINQVLDTPPGELPPFVAYRLNGELISLERGGPVRMIVPWAHGFKSIKWLQNVVLTDDYQANDTYALANNDPESYLKTAAYLDETDATYPAGKAVVIQGTAMVGWPGLERVEYWLRPGGGDLKEDDPVWKEARWRPCVIDPPPANFAAELPADVNPARIWGFTPDGRPKEWPMRFSVAPWSVSLEGLQPGDYQFRVRTVDRNGFAQPEPRPFAQRSGINGVQCKKIHIAGNL